MDAVRAALRDMLGPDVGIGVTDPAVGGDLWPVEEAAIARAIPKRRKEFASGRRAARDALAEIGIAPTAIAQGPDRAPLWPAGIIGSIAHCDTCCIAVAAHQTNMHALGIDIEPAAPLDRDLIAVVCTPAEQPYLDAAPDVGLAAMHIFSAKEAVYKAQYPLTRSVIGFDAVSLDFVENCFSVSADLALPQLKGMIGVVDDLIISVAHAQAPA